jgi:hypothetical protein
MKRRSVLRAGVAGGVAVLLPRFAIGQSADARVLRFVPQANLTVLDPIVTTAAVTANSPGSKRLARVQKLSETRIRSRRHAAWRIGCVGRLARRSRNT